MNGNPEVKDMLFTTNGVQLVLISRNILVVFQFTLFVFVSIILMDLLLSIAAFISDMISAFKYEVNTRLWRNWYEYISFHVSYQNQMNIYYSIYAIHYGFVHTLILEDYSQFTRRKLKMYIWYCGSIGCFETLDDILGKVTRSWSFWLIDFPFAKGHNHTMEQPPSPPQPPTKKVVHEHHNIISTLVIQIHTHKHVNNQAINQPMNQYRTIHTGNLHDIHIKHIYESCVILLVVFCINKVMVLRQMGS